MQKAQRRIPGFHKLEPGQETSFRLGSSSQPVQQVRGKRHRPCRSGPSGRRSLAGLGLARPAGSSFLVIVSCGNPCVGCCRCILPSRPWFRIRPRCQATSKHPEPAATLSSKLRRCQAKPRFELSNMGLLSTVAIARAGLLGCYAGYRVPRQGIGHMENPTGRATDAVMLVGWWCYARVLALSTFPRIQSLPVFSCAPAATDVLVGCRLPQLHWRFP